jgi:hypothetical protein
MQALRDHPGGSRCLSRHGERHRISEFMQLALDVIISEQYPEFRERIIANADKRLEQYHGA